MTRLFLALMLASWLTVGCGQDSCTDTFHVDAAHGERDKSGSRGETKRCGDHRPAKGNSNAYVVHDGAVYFREEHSSVNGTCVGNFGSYSSAGRSFCPMGTTTYTTDMNELFPLQPAPDARSFQSVSQEYGVDKAQLYYKQFAVRGVEALPAGTPVQPLMQPYDEAGQGLRTSSYATYGAHVFFEGHPVEGADAESFKVLFLSNGKSMQTDSDAYVFYDFARDKARVYWRGVVLDDSDPESFKVASRTFVQDRKHTWQVFFDDIGLVLPNTPKALGGDYFRSNFTSAAGVPYSRVQWRGKLKDDRNLFYALPLPMLEGGDFTVLKPSCKAKDRPLGTHPEFNCVPSREDDSLEFGRTATKAFFRDLEVQGADAASFQFLEVTRYADGRFAKAYAIDAHTFYRFSRRDEKPSTVALQGPVVGTIPGEYGWFDLMADSQDIYDYTLAQSARLCRYAGPSSTSGLKVVGPRDGTGDQPFIVLANDKYRYVFYRSQPSVTPNRSHVVEVATGKRFYMYEQTGDDAHPCGPMAAS